MTQTKKMYVSPHIEIIRVENEGVIATSADAGVYTPVEWNSYDPRSQAGTRSTVATDELEDMINDILQFND